MYYYKVVFPIKLEKELIYKSPKYNKSLTRVFVDFRNNLKLGIITGQSKGKPKFECKEIVEFLDSEPLISGELFDLAIWMRDYYLVPLGLIVFSMLPQGLKATKNYRVKGLKEKSEIAEFQSVLEIIGSKSSISIKDLKTKSSDKSIARKLIKMKKAGLICLKVKGTSVGRIQNYIVAKKSIELSSLTENQRFVMELLNKKPNGFFVSDIAEDVSYSTLGTLSKRGLIQIERRLKKPISLFRIKKRDKKEICLTKSQKDVCKQIQNIQKSGEFKPILLFGITGSGKTEIYLDAIKRTFRLGKRAIFLLPEISLTPMMVERFYNELEDKQAISVLHSSLTEAERTSQWKRIFSGEVKLVIGARSAVFAPISNIGLFIVDEEHENTFKQSTNPRYNARDVAIVRAKKNDALVILGSATPSLESYKNARGGKYKLLQLTQRPYSAQMPHVEIVDMKKEEDELFSQSLKDSIAQVLAEKRQIILFQNRRGFATFLQCTSCGELVKCPNCDIGLSYHSTDKTLLCHYCSYKIPLPRKCPSCSGYTFVFGSAGTQKAEIKLRELFPSAKVLRVDTDSTRAVDSFTNLHRRMTKKEVDILIGTQMIAKGFDFHNVTLVGVLSADLLLNIPDFRATERCFSLLTQIGGRSGRGKSKGKVIIQTFNPKHYSIVCSQNNNYERFSEVELAHRRILFYPPFCRMARLVYTSKNELVLAKNLGKLGARLGEVTKMFSRGELKLLGPTPCPISKINNKFYWHIILKAKKRSFLQNAVDILRGFKLPSNLNLAVDIDPGSLM